MEHLKNYEYFIKKEDNKDILKNIKDTPSELWTEEMVDVFMREQRKEKLSNVNDDENCCTDGLSKNKKTMVNNPEEEEVIVEKKTQKGDKKMMYSELQPYDLRNIYFEEE